ncbi:MAG: GlxA family transcriptional regulator [Ahrensia sp.]|nr:GlxA family transcriptional regulator [Ahrensia sp.]
MQGAAITTNRGAQTSVRNVVFYLMPEFSMIAFTSAIEALRCANRMLGNKAYSWRLSSANGKSELASNNVEVTVNTSIEDERKLISGADKPTLFLVCGGTNVEHHVSKALTGIIREEHARGIAIGGLCTGAYAIASAGLLSGKRCTIHWENLPAFQEKFPKAEVYADLFEVDSNIYTCAGGTAALDMMLSLIGQDFNDDLVNRICEQLLTDRVRAPSDRQRLPLRARLGVQNTRVLSIIELMENSLSEPLSLLDIADHVGLSRRQIERLFQQEMGRSPARYYLEIRLDRSRHLLVQSSLPVVEIAIACGFVSASHFSKCYRELYAKSPQQERAERKQLLIA